MKSNWEIALSSSVGDPDESLGMAIGESPVQLQQETPTVWEMLVPWDGHQEQKQPWSEASLSLESNLYVLQRVELGKWP